MFHIAKATVLGLSLVVSSYACAQVVVTDAWVRSTVPNQSSTGAFMKLKADEDSKLVGASSPVAKVTEIHEMTMENDVMKMGKVPAIALPAGSEVSLDVNGYHVMLMGLVHQVKEGETVPLTLMVEDHAGHRQSVHVAAVVRSLTAQ